jgi:hypothetical protein
MKINSTAKHLIHAKDFLSPESLARISNDAMTQASRCPNPLWNLPLLQIAVAADHLKTLCERRCEQRDKR